MQQILERSRDLIGAKLQSSANFKYLEGRFRKQFNQMVYGVISMAIVFGLFIALVTSPLWITLLIINLPLIGVIGGLMFYTNVSVHLIHMF